VHSVHLPEKLLDIAHNPKLFYKMKEKMQAVQYNINKQRITAIFFTLSLLGRKCADNYTDLKDC